MGDRALRALSQYGEAHVFLRGLVIQLGFKTATVTYDRLPRPHGETKYTLAKMVALSVNGITSLSVRPIRIIALMGIVLFVVYRDEHVGVRHMDRRSDRARLDVSHAAVPPHRIVPDLRHCGDRRICRKNL